MRDDTPIPDRVQRGVELLDRVRPGWERSIDLGSLDIAICTRCVLGQLFGHYVDGKEALGIDGPGDRCGFASAGLLLWGEETALANAWRERIEARLVGSEPEPGAAS